MSGALAIAHGGAIAVTLSPTSVSGWSDPGATANISTASVLATPNGGVTPYTYSWARVDSSAYTWTIGTPTAASTNFTGNSIPVGVNTGATFEVTVTDAAGNKAKKQINATVRNKVTDFNKDFGGTL